MTTAAIDIRGVSKVYNPGSKQPVTALETVSLTINDNEFFTLLGPSGCGKTTLLRLIAGFEEVSDGEIMLFGDEIEHLQPSERPVNTVFQHYALFPHMSVAANVAFGLERLKRPKDEIASTVEQMLSLVKMNHLADRRPSQLSGGQQQRVALARALAMEPPVLLADEPTGNLDPALTRDILDHLTEIQGNGTTILLATHDPIVKEHVDATRLLYLDAGELVDDVPTPHLRAITGELPATEDAESDADEIGAVA